FLYAFAVIGAAMAFRWRAEERWQRQPRTAPACFCAQIRQVFDLKTEGFIIAEMPVETVQPVPAQQVEKTLDLAGCVKTPGHVKGTAAPDMVRFIIDQGLRGKAEMTRFAPRATRHLGQRNQPVQHAGTVRRLDTRIA